MYCVPYDTGKVLMIDPVKEIFEEVGEKTKDAVSKYTECAAAHNFTGFLYAAPFKGTDYVLEINPMTGIVREVGERIPHHTSDAMWWGVKASPTCLKIFAAPYDARRVLMIDPNNGGRAVEVGPDLGDVRGKYCCLELAPNGNLYAPPFNASQVLQIDSKGNVSLTGPKLGGSKVRKYSCLVLGANKLLYAPPLEADQVLEINPNRGDSKLIGPVIGTGEAKYACACLHSNRKIYAAPLEGRRVLEIDCEDHEVREIGFDLGSEMEKYSCICEAPVTGKLYAAPRAARQFLEIDPEKGFVREVGPDLGPLARKYTVMLPGRPIQPPPVVKVERFATTAAVPKQLAAPPVAQ
ncbi:unnamed protein product [Polarella glacialis]|uniref:Uncharacterized protein n=1 Tax=Polarella glacialis TaxID=89957 RepID=A0A813LPM7_POLGL|nr:unnamed protein product [Polarella glacialis]